VKSPLLLWPCEAGVLDSGMDAGLYTVRITRLMPACDTAGEAPCSFCQNNKSLCSSLTQIGSVAEQFEIHRAATHCTSAVSACSALQRFNYEQHQGQEKVGVQRRERRAVVRVRTSMLSVDTNP
jgi:hypothetical protein